MEINSEKLERITFPKAVTGGYKKADVDDFLRLTARDYRRFEQNEKEQEEKVAQLLQEIEKLQQENVQQSERQQEQLATMKATISDLNKKLATFIQKDQLPQPGTPFQEAIMIAQDTAFEIEQEADQEKTRILEEAEFERGRIIKNARTESAAILEAAKQEQRRIAEQAEQIKRNAENHSAKVEKHYEEVLKQLSETKRKQEEQAKSELSRLTQQQRKLQQDLSASKQEELNFIESQMYGYKSLLNRLDQQKWQQLAQELTERIQAI